MRRETAEGGSPEPFPGAAFAVRNYAAALISGGLYDLAHHIPPVAGERKIASAPPILVAMYEHHFVLHFLTNAKPKT